MRSIILIANPNKKEKKMKKLIIIISSTASFKANVEYLGQGVPGYDNGPPAGYGSPSYTAPNNYGNSGMDYINQMQAQQQQQQQLYQQQQIMEQLQENNMRQNMRSSYR